jgi:hypothetical protein
MPLSHLHRDALSAVSRKRMKLTSHADPEGDFVEAIGRNFTADQAAKVISDHINDWEGPLKKKDRWA